MYMYVCMESDPEKFKISPICSQSGPIKSQIILPWFVPQLNLALEQREQIKDMTEDLQALDAESKHIETGVVDCGGEWDWSEGKWGEKTRTAAFSRPYINPPKAFVSVTGFRSRYSNMYVSFKAKGESVNTTHIEVMCHQHQAGSIVRYLGVRWITFPQ